jgi:hypothetical protein
VLWTDCKSQRFRNYLTYRDVCVTDTLQTAGYRLRGLDNLRSDLSDLLRRNRQRWHKGQPSFRDARPQGYRAFSSSE